MKRLMSILALGFVLGVATATEAPQEERLEVEAAIERIEEIQKKLETLQAQGAARADDPRYFYELGNVLVDLSRREEAVAVYEKALELDPEYVEALVNLGAIKNELGATDEAIELLKRAIEVNPEDAKAYVNLGDAYYSRGNYYEAMQSFREALRVDPGSYEAHHRIAVAFADAQIYREAIREWEKVIELAPGTDAATAAQENIDVVRQILERKM